MKKIIFISLVILVSCTSKNASEINFERLLPEKDLNILNEMVDSYDQLINTKFDGDYDRLITDVINEVQMFSQKDSLEFCQLIKKFDESSLEYKRERVAYDTVYASNYFKIGDKKQFSEKLIIITITNEQDTSWQDFVAIDVETVEDKIMSVKNEGYWKHISESTFVNALIELNSKGENITDYIDRKISAGYVNPKMMANGILNHEIDQNDYFIKRIIVFELYGNLIKENYGC